MWFLIQWHLFWCKRHGVTMIREAELDLEKAYRFGKKTERHLTKLCVLLEQAGVATEATREALTMHHNHMRELEKELSFSPADRSVRRWTKKRFLQVLGSQDWQFHRECLARKLTAENRYMFLFCCYSVCEGIADIQKTVTPETLAAIAKLPEDDKALLIEIVTEGGVPFFKTMPELVRGPFGTASLPFDKWQEWHERDKKLREDDHKWRETFRRKYRLQPMLPRPLLPSLPGYNETWIGFLKGTVNAEEVINRLNHLRDVVVPYAEELYDSDLCYRELREERARTKQLFETVMKHPEKIGKPAVRLRDTILKIRQKVL